MHQQIKQPVTVFDMEEPLWRIQRLAVALDFIADAMPEGRKQDAVRAIAETLNDTIDPLILTWDRVVQQSKAPSKVA